MIRLERMHRRNVKQWLTDSCDVKRFDQSTGIWQDIETIKCLVQTPVGSRQGGSDSSQDQEIASVEETTTIVVYASHSSNAEVGDRLEWEGETYTINTSSFRRTDQPYRKLMCSILQSAIVPESIGFWRILHNADGEIVGRESVGEYLVRFTEGMAVDPSAQTDGASGKILDGRIIAPLEAADIVIGDWFSRNEIPGRVTNVDRSAPDHIELAYTSERVVP